MTTEFRRSEDEELYKSIEQYIDGTTSKSFEELIVRLFKRQYELNGPYSTYCRNSKSSPASISDWTDIPAMPARGFKLSDLSCAPLSHSERIFYSSGTTEGNHSKHYMDEHALELYRLSLGLGYAQYLPADQPIIALMPNVENAPHSSLSFMLNSLNTFAFHSGDIERLAGYLTEIESQGNAVTIFGTAFAFVELFDSSASNWKLPVGSVVVETGGFKGRTREVSKDDLYAMIETRVGVSGPNIVAEYGMSEMASQFYDIGRTGFQSPNWLRTRIIDPITLKESEIGLLRIYDLANWNSVAVIQTEDMARRLPIGRFELLGRASDSELRGCSLMVEERWFGTD